MHLFVCLEFRERGVPSERRDVTIPSELRLVCISKTDVRVDDVVIS